jgi:hypothetical protein
MRKPRCTVSLRLADAPRAAQRHVELVPTDGYAGMLDEAPRPSAHDLYGLTPSSAPRPEGIPSAVPASAEHATAARRRNVTSPWRARRRRLA